jgi:hypothetical protein
VTISERITELRTRLGKETGPKTYALNFIGHALGELARDAECEQQPDPLAAAVARLEQARLDGRCKVGILVAPVWDLPWPGFAGTMFTLDEIAKAADYADSLRQPAKPQPEPEEMSAVDVVNEMRDLGWHWEKKAFADAPPHYRWERQGRGIAQQSGESPWEFDKRALREARQAQ